ncbi:hypothetical protein [Polyangium mundeleinium]|uniref:Uncharacterized protein n=1 Tax=Polyangium mundeleinium TaxID=2995306 RepID=A0ABT5ELX9_9BACT|nr:hypothetical protein [Polyangium mundeleinium]MDC0741927.1 hypothetical protein [Polyangium mundeleinium]
MVSGRRFVASILVLTEDGHHEPLRALVRRMLRLVDPNHDSTSIDVQGDHPQAQEAATANLAKGSHKQRVALARAIATHIYIEANFVFHHVDADRCFSDPRRDVPENVTFHEKVLVAVHQHLESLRQKHSDSRAPDSFMRRVKLLVPYYSIEAWLFQNTRVGRALCQKHHRGQHAGYWNVLEQDRRALDEIEKPKKNPCMDARYYVDLASKDYPASAVYDVGKSFTQAVDGLKKCEPLCAALAATYAPETPGAGSDA